VPLAEGLYISVAISSGVTTIPQKFNTLAREAGPH